MGSQFSALYYTPEVIHDFNSLSPRISASPGLSYWTVPNSRIAIVMARTNTYLPKFTQESVKFLGDRETISASDHPCLPAVRVCNYLHRYENLSLVWLYLAIHPNRFILSNLVSRHSTFNCIHASCTEVRVADGFYVVPIRACHVVHAMNGWFSHLCLECARQLTHSEPSCFNSHFESFRYNLACNYLTQLFSQNAWDNRGGESCNFGR